MPPTSFRAALAAGLLIFGHGALPSPAPTPVYTQSGRPVVLIMHGRGVQGQDSATLRRVWVEALEQGLAAVGAPPLLEHGDARLIWYADALDPRTPACLSATAEEQRGGAAEVGGALASVGALLALAADWLGDAEAETLRALAGDLLYLGDRGKRCAAEARLADALASAAREGRPALLVAHSFGSLVAYHHLGVRDASAAPRVERLVTVGSLIGHPELRTLLFGSTGERTLPEGVGSWVNVRDPSDPFAAPLVGVGTPADSAVIMDRKTERTHGGDAHDAGRYLADPATARALLEAWCAAASGAARPEQACDAASL